MAAPKVAFSLPKDIYAQAEKRAAELGVTVNAYAKECLRTALLDYATRHHVYVKASVGTTTHTTGAATTTSVARTTCEPRWKQSMKGKT